MPFMNLETDLRISYPSVLCGINFKLEVFVFLPAWR
jgi:hypothetical protein